MVYKIILACALLVTLLPCLALSEPCKYVMQPDTRVGGAYSAKLDGVQSLQACLDFLLANADSHVAVSYNREKRECCAASVDVPLVLEAESGWMTYELSNVGPEPIFSTTEATTINPIAACNSIDMNSGLSSIQTKFNGTIRLINCTVVDNVTLAFYEGHDPKVPLSLTWLDAKKLCESAGWWLARLVTPSLLEATAQMFRDFQPNIDAALGGVYDEQMGNYVWYNTTIPVPIDYYSSNQLCVFGYISPSTKSVMKLKSTHCSGYEPRFICSSA